VGGHVLLLDRVQLQGLCLVVALHAAAPEGRDAGAQEARRLHQAAGVILIVLLFAALGFSMTSNIMAVYPSTKCYRLEGGKGTVNGTCPLPPKK